jgi:hypothetical protein
MDFVEIEANDQRFRLYFDRDQSGVLHIHARHGMTAEDAVALFYEGKRDWNEQRRRFESRLGQRVLFWTWLYGREGGTVIVLSCFEVQEGTE